MDFHFYHTFAQTKTYTISYLFIIVEKHLNRGKISLIFPIIFAFLFLSSYAFGQSSNSLPTLPFQSTSVMQGSGSKYISVAAENATPMQARPYSSTPRMIGSIDFEDDDIPTYPDPPTLNNTPIGDGTVFMIIFAIIGMSIRYYKNRKHKQLA